MWLDSSTGTLSLKPVTGLTYIVPFLFGPDLEVMLMFTGANCSYSPFCPTRTPEHAGCSVPYPRTGALPSEEPVDQIIGDV